MLSDGTRKNSSQAWPFLECCARRLVRSKVCMLLLSLSGPRIADCLSCRSPSIRQIGHVCKSLISFQNLVQANDGTISRIIRRPTQELPIAIGVVANQKNRQLIMNHRLRREHGPIASVMKRPMRSVVQNRLALAKGVSSFG